MALDPVCGMTVDPAKAAGEFEHKATKYYICSKHCVHAFSSDPERYLSRKAGAAHAHRGAHHAMPVQIVGKPAARKGSARSQYTRSEERRVGKECRSRWSAYH